MTTLSGVHHVAIIASDYDVSKRFYLDVIGCEVVSEMFRAERNSHKLNLRLPDGIEIELFSFPTPPVRVSHPEACGLRHLALRVGNIEAALAHLRVLGVTHEDVRIDELTGARFCFFADPDGLPIELYEVD